MVKEKASISAMLDRVGKRAAEYQYAYKGCGQSAFLALHDEFHFPGGDAVFKAATFTGAGIARMEGVCGAVIGAVLAMGLVAGRDRIEDPMYAGEIDKGSGLPRTLLIVRDFYRSFLDEFGSCMCGDIRLKLLGTRYNLGIPDELRRFEMEGGHETRARVVERCARLAAETIVRLQAEMNNDEAKDVQARRM